MVTPGDTKVSAKTHTVTQPAAVSALSGNGYEFEAAGESCEVRVSLADIVQWEIENKLAWVTVSGATTRVGPGTVVCVLEAMKLFTEVQAECSGEIVEVLVKNGDFVEYGQPLFRVKV